MKINYNVNGEERKRLVHLMADIIGCKAKYLGVPSYAYQVGVYHIDKNGLVTCDNETEGVNELAEKLMKEGFEPVGGIQETTLVCISMPEYMFSDTTMENLRNILEAKGTLIKKAFGVDELPVLIEGGKVSFPWFECTAKPEEIRAYDQFICKLCEMARNQKKITAKKKKVENEKYAFRCFLLRLGFIGAEYKEDRQILLRNLEGNSAFKTAKTQEGEEECE